MQLLNASQDNPQSREQILTKAGWESEGKHAFDRLKKFEMVKAARGLGMFLTKKGLQKAREITKRT